MKKDKNNIITKETQRSDKIQKLLDEKPSPFILYGNLFLFIIFVVVFILIKFLL